jgi:hypothetical protein
MFRTLPSRAASRTCEDPPPPPTLLHSWSGRNFAIFGLESTQRTRLPKLGDRSLGHNGFLPHERLVPSSHRHTQTHAQAHAQTHTHSFFFNYSDLGGFCVSFRKSTETGSPWVPAECLFNGVHEAIRMYG